MARSGTATLLPLEEYARIMSIPGWHFNQVQHPGRPRRGAADDFWVQSGYSGDPNRIVGRDEVAQAISEAERQIAHVCRFWPAPRWFCGDRERLILWPDPVRGQILTQPVLRTRWGYLISAGVETWTQINEDPVAIVYTDTDYDGITDWATITYGLYMYGADECDIEVVPVGQDPEGNWSIKPLDISVDAGILTIEGPKWMFVDPEIWNGITPAHMDDDDDFLTHVNIWNHWNDPHPAGVIRWLPDQCGAGVSDRYQEAMITVLRERTGAFYPTPASYDESSRTWTRASMTYCESPQGFYLWYYAGLRDTNCDDCSYMSTALKRAIVSLANCYMADPPCGSTATMERWKRDNEDQEMTTYNVAMANSHFGTSKRGAVYTYSVIRRIPPLGKGG